MTTAITWRITPEVLSAIRQETAAAVRTGVRKALLEALLEAFGADAQPAPRARGIKA